MSVSPTYSSKKTMKAIYHVFSPSDPHGILIVFALLSSLGWFTNGSYEFFKSFLEAPPQWNLLWSGFPFLLVFLYALLQVRHARRNVRPKMERSKNLNRAKVLILFLSPFKNIGPPQTPEALQAKEFLDGVCAGQIKATLQEALEKLDKNTWAMPLKALDYHRETLERLIVIPSADSKKQVGTHQEFGQFKALVEAIWSSCQKMTVKGMGTINQNYQQGVDFEDAPALVEAIDDVYKYLLNQHYSAEQILIDVTGGQKLTTVAGAAVSLVEGRLFQYVSTIDKQVAIFNVTYRLETE